MTRPSVRIERRLVQRRWLPIVVPIGSLVVAFGAIAVVLLVTGHAPLPTFRRLFDAAFVADGALTNTLISATPLAFTGLAAAVAFRMRLFNIGAEGQLYFGAIGAAGIALLLAGQSAWLIIPAMIVAGAACGAAWGAIPGVLRAFAHTNEIITSLMLNYVAALVLNYLIFDSLSYWRDTSATGQLFPQGKTLPDAAAWPTFTLGSVTVPFGFVVAIVVAAVVWVLYTRTRFGFETQVIGDSPRAARYAGMRTRRKIVAVLCLSGAIAGIGGASQDGDFRHVLDARGLQQANYGYTGIVVAALARYNPFATVLVAFLLGGLENAGYTLQGADFPSGLVGMMQGIILFAMLGGELLVRYRVVIERSGSVRRCGGHDVNDGIVVVVLAAAVAYGTPLLFAALGELLAERSGVLNLGVEGMMLMGAVIGFLCVQHVGGSAGVALPIAVAAAAVAGGGCALILAFLVVTLRANQIVSGLALTIFAGAAGLSSYIGNDFELADDPARFSFEPLNVLGLGDLPVFGPVVFEQTWLVYASWLAVAAVAFYLWRTRPGLNVRAVGESPAAADAMGIDVTRYRYLHTVAGGALAGIGGACFSLALTPQWVDGLTAGAGWIAIALVIFAFWRPDLCLVGAYVFGGLSALPLILQARGVTIAPQLFQALPYVMTILVLVIVSTGTARRRLGAPAALGIPYVREER